MFPIKSSPIPTMCVVDGCDRRVRQSKDGSYYGCACSRHADAVRRARYPTAHLYKTIRWNAKQRGIPFLITREQWDEWCIRTGYAQRVGQGADDLTVDRKDSRMPYHINNIRAITRTNNSVKGCAERYEQRGWIYGPGGRKIKIAPTAVVAMNEEEKVSYYTNILIDRI
jgi:hypothetical protein